MLRTTLRLALLLLLTSGTLAAQLPPDTIQARREPLFTKQDPWIAAGFLVGTLALAPADRHFARRLQDPRTQANRFLRHQATNVRLIAHPGSLIIGGSLYTIGRLTRQRDVADLGLHGTEAILIGEAISMVMKGFIGRARPFVDIDNPHDYGFGRGFTAGRFRSFPSGHTIAGFAAAAAVTSETRRWWPEYTWVIAPAMYGGATLVGLSRMYNNYHWASDVMMGAAIGTFAGLKIVRFHHNSRPGNWIDHIFLGATAVPDGRGGAYVGWSLETP